MVKAASFVLSVGQAVQVRWHESEDGCINFSINYSTASPGGIERPTAHDKSSWTYAERCGDEWSTITFEALIPDTVDSNDSSASTIATKIRKKIRDSWEKTEQKLKRNFTACEEPADFLGISTFETTEELSYRSLGNSSNDLHLFQNPFHEVNLACLDGKRIQTARLSSSSFSIPNCRVSLLNNLHPGYGKLDKQERKNISKRYNAIIAKGNALFRLSRDNVDLLLTVGSILNGKDLDLISEQLCQGVSISELLGDEVIKDSRKYEGWALKICNQLEWIRNALEEKQEEQHRAIVPQKRQFPYAEQDDAFQRTMAIEVPPGKPFTSRTDTHLRNGSNRERGTAAITATAPAALVQCDGLEQQGVPDCNNMVYDGVSGMKNHYSSGDMLDGDLSSLCSEVEPRIDTVQSPAQIMIEQDSPGSDQLGEHQVTEVSTTPATECLNLSFHKQYQGVSGADTTGNGPMDEIDLPSVCVTDVLAQDGDIGIFENLYGLG